MGLCNLLELCLGLSLVCESKSGSYGVSSRVFVAERYGYIE